MGLIPACAGSTARRQAASSARRAHPRLRGEHNLSSHSFSHHCGSSPPARGALERHPVGADHGGLIPACAGSTPPTSWPSPPERAHPRLRGEHDGPTEEHFRRTGSSPPARGARHPLCVERSCQGLIPACAGSTSGASVSDLQLRAHPRLRGEHVAVESVDELVDGSSPPARGAPTIGGAAAAWGRLIPACAGSTHHHRAGYPLHTAHPRLRGEHFRVLKPGGTLIGSSPPARGAPPRDHLQARQVGLIPACAGSTHLHYQLALSTPAHPRLRGEHQHIVEDLVRVAGSSPPARGARERQVVENGQSRLIPACAGSTRYRCCAGWCTGAHPRLRGEHFLSASLQPRHGGSSPPARGAPVDKLPTGCVFGLIPACAGSTG